MKRWVTTLVGAAAVVISLWLVAHNFRAPKAVGRDPHPARSLDDDGGGLLYAYGDGGPAGSDASPLLLSDLLEGERRFDAGIGNVMPDGTPVPPLPMNAPHQIRFGVVLVSYAGAQPSAAGGRPATRAKAEAKAMADRLLTSAGQDFHAAVQQGDSGSADDVGRVKLGILEPAPEYLLFTLAVDGVAGPVDTPRGYWIIKRLE